MSYYGIVYHIKASAFSRNGDGSVNETLRGCRKLLRVVEINNQRAYAISCLYMSTLKSTSAIVCKLSGWLFHGMATVAPTKRCTDAQMLLFGWHYLSNAACLLRPRLCDMCVCRVKEHHKVATGVRHF